MNIRYGVTETIGFRERMEDTHAVGQHQGMFSAEVYDGHGGQRAAMAASEMVTPFFLSLLTNGEGKGIAEERFTAETLRKAYLATDRYIVDRGIESGTAAVTLYIHKDKFLAANTGDSRIAARDGTLSIELTLDHKPDLPAERARIEASGGTIIDYDVPRVQGSLAMSRALGDVALKPFVSAEPRIVEGLLGRRTDLAVLACDGLWDVLTSEEAIRMVQGISDPQEAAERLQNRALKLGSTDNITVIVLDLSPYTASFERERLHITRIVDYAAQQTP